MLLSAVSTGFSIVLDPSDTMGCLGGKVGIACEEFEDNRLV